MAVPEEDDDDGIMTLDSDGDGIPDYMDDDDDGDGIPDHLDTEVSGDMSPRARSENWGASCTRV